MKNIVIIAGIAVVAAGATVFALTSKQDTTAQPEPIQRAAVEQSMALPSVEEDQSETAYQPAKKQKTRGLEFQVTAGKSGTVCETPTGSVCNVEPSSINSRCDCDGSVGRIVR